jgi:hypothetical protein
MRLLRENAERMVSSFGFLWLRFYHPRRQFQDFDVMGIDGSMQLELGTAVGVAASVVEGDARRPQVRRFGRGEPGKAIKAFRSLGPAAAFEIGSGANENRPSSFSNVCAGAAATQRQTTVVRRRRNIPR